MLSHHGIDKRKSATDFCLVAEPDFDADPVGPWPRSTGKAVAKAMAWRSLVVNIPIKLLTERDADSLGHFLTRHGD